MPTQWAPVRFATGIASAKWSAWPWLTAMWVGLTSSPLVFAAGLLGARNGSTRTVVSPSLSSKHECPCQGMSISGLSFVLVLTGKLFVKCPADGDANHHPHARLLGEQRPDRGEPL